MTRKIHLNGEMSTLFGQQYAFGGETVQDAIRCIDANNPGFKQYLMACHENDIGFSISVYGNDIEDPIECLLPLREGDIVITPVVAGSKSGGGKILAAIAIAFILFWTGGVAASGGLITGGTTGSIFSAMMAGGAASQMAAMSLAMLSLNLATAGIQQLMAPDPSVDDDEDPKGYMISGASQNVVEGDPIPLLYGELRVPGRPVSFEINNKFANVKNEVYTYGGSLISDADASGRDEKASGAYMPGSLEAQYAHNESVERDTLGGVNTVYGRSQNIIITDVISEGPIYGLVEASSSVYLNDDPAVDPGDAAKSLTRTAATFSFTNGSTSVTYNSNGQTALIDIVGTRYINIRDYKTTTSHSTIPVKVVTKSNNNALKDIQVVTSSSFFPTDGSWLHDSLNTTSSPKIRLSKNGVLKFEGYINSVQSAINANCTPYTYDYLNDWEETDADGNVIVYDVHIDYAVSFKTVSGSTITLDASFTGPTGEYKADITGANRGIEDLQRGLGEGIKYDGFKCNFIVGDFEQINIPAEAGTGLGSIAIAANPNNAIAGPLEDGAENEYIYQGTNHFGLSAIQASEADEIRVLFVYGSIINTSNNGTPHNGKAWYEISISLYDGANWGAYKDIYPATSRLRHARMSKTAVSIEEIINLKPFGNFIDFKLKITRISENTRAYKEDWNNGWYNDEYTSSTQCTISTLNTIIKEKLSYPLTAMAWTTFNTKSFPSPPRRTYHCKGLLVKVPSNYVTREEATDKIANYRRNVSTEVIHATDYQNWDGNFRTNTVYTNNPAWIFYDIITNNRYGLGSFIAETDIDKYALYRIARYCDEMVPDGSGGQEPRFTCNVYFAKRADAYKVLKDLATVFRGMLYWLDGNIFPVMDEPKDPVYNFTAGNVIEGQFGYESTGSKTRANQVVVTWTNPEQNYKQEALLVEDKQNILDKNEIISENAVAFGATSEGQALRYGRWKLWTAKNQTEVVTFSTSINAAFLAPGDIVNIQDAARSPSKVQYSGRVSSTGTPSTTSIPLDRGVDLTNGSTYKLAVLIEKPAVFLSQDSATINGVPYSKGELILKASGDYTESEAANIIQTNGSGTPILGSNSDDPQYYQKQQPVSVSWQPHTRVEEQTVSTSYGNNITTLTVSTAFDEIPKANTIWALKETNADNIDISGSKRPYKILSIAEGEKDYTITAVEHYNDKFMEVDEDFVLTVEDTVIPAVKASDTVPAPRHVHALIVDTTRSGMLKDDVTLYWDHPTVAGSNTSDLYQHVLYYEIHHNSSEVASPIIVDKSQNSVSGIDIDPGTYTLGMRTVSTIGTKSGFSEITITIGDPIEDDGVPRYASMPIGGVLSRDIDLVATTSPTAKTFKILNSSYKISSVASPLTIVTKSGGNAATYQQDCTNIASVNYASLSTDFDRQVAAHYIFFDASDNSDPLKLIKYYIDTTLGLNYFYDAGTGNSAASTNFTTAGTGTVTVGANAISVVGTGTAFTTDYKVGDIIYFTNTKAAKVNYIASDTDLRLDRSFTTAISAGAAHYPQKFKFDKKYDTVIASVRNNNGTFEMFPSNLTINKDLNNDPRVVVLSADPTLLAFDGASTPALKSGQDNTITLTVDAQGFQNPEFKITGAGFSHTDISQSAETSFTNNGTTTYSKALSALSTHSDTNLVFTATVRETDDPENTAKQATSTITVSLLKDGTAGTTGGTGPAGPDGDSLYTWVKYAENADGSVGFTNTYVQGTTIYIGHAYNKTTATESTTASDYTWSLFEGSGTAGLNQATAYLFQVNNSDSTPPADPDGDLTYTFSTSTVTGSNFNGWTTTRPATSITNPYRWVIAAPASSSTATDTIASGDWAGAVLDSAEGYQSATVYLYQRNNTKTSPAEPDNNTTYTFSTKVLSGDLDGWSQDIGASGDYIHVTTAIALAVNSDTSDVIAPGDWSDPVVLSQTADSRQELTIYKESETAITSAPTGGDYNFTTRTFTPPTGWTSYIPTGNHPKYSSNGVASIEGKTGIDDDITWSVPIEISGKIGKGNTTGYVYWQTRQAAAPTDNDSGTNNLPTAASYNVVTRTFTTLKSGWGIDPPTYQVSSTAATNTNKYWYASFNATENSSGSGTASGDNLTFGTVRQGIGFTNLVTFDSEDTGHGRTEINGGFITTKQIKSKDYTANNTTDFADAGVLFNLEATGNENILEAKKFYIQADGDAVFGGTLSASALSSASITEGTFKAGADTNIAGYDSVVIGQGSSGYVGIAGTSIGTAGVAGAGSGSGYGGWFGYSSNDTWNGTFSNQVNLGRSDYAVYAEGGFYFTPTSANYKIGNWTKIPTANATDTSGTSQYFLRGDGTFAHAVADQANNSGKFLKTDGFTTSWQAAPGTGTVTSINVIAPLSGGTITATGTIGVNDLGIERGKIANDAIDGTKIEDDAVTAAHIADDSINIGHLNTQGNPGTTTFLNGDYEWTTVSGTQNYYLKDVTRAGNVLTFEMQDTTDQTFTFGSNAFTSYADPTSLGYTNNTGDITAVTAGSGLTGGGTSGDVTLNVIGGTGLTAAADAINLDNTAVSAGTYGSATKSPQITIDAQGRITSASDVTITGSGGGGTADGYLSAVTKSGTDLIFTVTDANNITFSDFGANAFNSTTIPTNNNQLTNGAGYVTTDTNTITSLNAGGGAQTGALTFNGTAVSQSGTTFTFTDTDTTYSVGDGGLTQKNFTTTLKTKLDGIEPSATADQTAAEIVTLINGQAITPSTVTATEVTATSDIRLKTNVQTIENSLEKVSKMRGVTFDKIEGASSGVIAQELEQIAPELVKDGEYKSVAYGNLVGYLIEAIKELKDKVEELENG